MAFEIHKKIRQNRKIKENGISIRKCAIYLGSNIGNDLASKGLYIILLIDKDNKKIGIRNCSENDVNSFKITKRENKNTPPLCYFHCEAFIRNIKRGRYDVNKENDMWVFKYKDIENEN